MQCWGQMDVHLPHATRVGSGIDATVQHSCTSLIYILHALMWLSQFSEHLFELRMHEGGDGLADAGIQTSLP